jgi:hypothetical protein
MNTMAFPMPSRGGLSETDMMDLELEGIGDNDFDFFGSSSSPPASAYTPAPNTHQSFAAPSPSFSMTAPSPFAIPTTPAPPTYAAPSPAPFTPQPSHPTPYAAPSPGPTSPAFVAHKSATSIPLTIVGQGATTAAVTSYVDQTVAEEHTSPAYIAGTPRAPMTPFPMHVEPESEPFQVPFVEEDLLQHNEGGEGSSNRSSDDVGDGPVIPSQWKCLNVQFGLIWAGSEMSVVNKYEPGGRFSYNPSSAKAVPTGTGVLNDANDGGTTLGKRRREDAESETSDSDGGDDSSDSDESSDEIVFDPLAALEIQLHDESYQESLRRYEERSKAIKRDDIVYKGSVVALSLIGLGHTLWYPKVQQAIDPELPTRQSNMTTTTLSTKGSPEKISEMSPMVVPKLESESSLPQGMDVNEEEEEVVEEGEVNDTAVPKKSAEAQKSSWLSMSMSLNAPAESTTRLAQPSISMDKPEPVDVWGQSLLHGVVNNWSTSADVKLAVKLYIEGLTLGRGFRFMDSDDWQGWTAPSFSPGLKAHPAVELKHLLKVTPLVVEAFPVINNASTPGVKDASVSKTLLSVQQYFELQGMSIIVVKRCIKYSNNCDASRA